MHRPADWQFVLRSVQSFTPCLCNSFSFEGCLFAKRLCFQRVNSFSSSSKNITSHKMSKMRVEPSGSGVSKVESDITHTITLADTIVALIREPVTLLYQNIIKGQQLKQSLGPWKGEAFDENRRCQIPVLRREEFEEYMVKIDGIVPPCMPPDDKESLDTKGSSRLGAFRMSWGLNQSPASSSIFEKAPTASGCWTYFLYALGICPDMGIVRWGPSTDGFISTQNGGIEMELEGSALCHIINIYGTTLDPNSRARPSPEIFPGRRHEKPCQLRFGKPAWETSKGQIHSHFQLGLEIELVKRKVPFGTVGQLMGPNTLAVSYLTALEHGVSNPKFRLEESASPLPKRIEAFLRCFDKLESRRWKSLLV
jgi:hypothetical protein